MFGLTAPSATPVSPEIGSLRRIKPFCPLLLVVSEFEDQACFQAPERTVLLAGLVEDVGSPLDLLVGLGVEHLTMDIVGLLVELVGDRLGKDCPLFHPEQV